MSQPFSNKVPHSPPTPSDTDKSPDVQPAAKKQTSGSTIPSKRTARSLNPEQLARKRANDREAQRAIRERTKTQIERLENRIAELESGEAFQQLQNVIKEKQQLQVENDDIRGRLEDVINLLSPVVAVGKVPSEALGAQDTTTDPFKVVRGDTQSLPDVSIYPFTQNSPADASGKAGSTTSAPADIDHFADTESKSQELPPEIQSWDWSNELERVHGLHCRSTDLFEIDQWNQHVNPNKALSEASIDIPQEPEELTFSDFNLETSLELQPPYPATGMFQSSMAPSSTAFAPSEPSTAEAQLPYNIPPTCRLDSILYDYTVSMRKQLDHGATLERTIGPPYADFNTVIYPKNATNERGISNLFVEISAVFKSFKGWPEKIAWISVNVLFLRWYISPSHETYFAMPEFMRPIDAQINLPHPRWVDYLPWPNMRAKMVYQYNNLPADGFLVPYTGALNLNWPTSCDLKSCLEHHTEDDSLRITPALSMHIFVLSNWSLGPDFAVNVPLLADTAPIKG